MTEEKPMTVKERMAALARASSGGVPAPTPSAPKAASTTTGPSVAERLAKMRAGPGGADAKPGGGGTPANKPGLVRSFTPPSNTPTVVTQSPTGDRGGGGSSVAGKIAALRGGGESKYSILPPSPSSKTAGSSSPPPPGKMSPGDGISDGSAPNVSGDSPQVFSGVAARMEAMKLNASSTSSDGGSGTGEKSSPAPVTGRISPGLAARLNAINSGSESSGGDKKASGDGTSSSAPKISAGLAARMGKAIPIPVPGGGMPPGGIAELKRRKNEKEEAHRAADGVLREKLSQTAPEQKPGQLQHANLSRPTISQRRRPRKTARPFKAMAVPPTLAQAETVTRPPAKVTPAEDAPPKQAIGEGPAAVVAAAPEEAVHGDEEGDRVSKMNSMLRAASAEVAGGDGDDDEWE